MNWAKLISLYYGLYYGGFLGSVVISVRVPRDLKEKIEKYGINVSSVVRDFLEKYVEELELKKLSSRLDYLKVRLAGKIDPKLIADLVREDRSR